MTMDFGINIQKCIFLLCFMMNSRGIAGPQMQCLYPPIPSNCTVKQHNNCRNANIKFIFQQKKIEENSHSFSNKNHKITS